MAEMVEKGGLRMGVEAEEEEEDGELEEGEIREVSLPRQPKHLLEKSWTFWFDSPNGKARQTTWGASLRAIYTFHSVEDFWGLYNNILPPSLLASGIDFYCFKAGIEPKWEDPYCAYGGRWTVSTARARNPFMDTFWLYTILAMIGEQFDDGDEICGAVINIRVKQEKLSIWTKTASNEAAQMSIGRQWKELLDYREKVYFYVHEDSKRQDKQPKSRYVVE